MELVPISGHRNQHITHIINRMGLLTEDEVGIQTPKQFYVEKTRTVVRVQSVSKCSSISSPRNFKPYLFFIVWIFSRAPLHCWKEVQEGGDGAVAITHAHQG
jgi:hypothetical protein